MTPKQKLVLDFIQMYVKVKGFAPSYADIAQGLQLNSKANIHRMVHKLKEEGLIEIQPHMVRSMKLVDKTVQHIEKL
jgi:repressor LexA